MKNLCGEIGCKMEQKPGGGGKPHHWEKKSEGFPSKEIPCLGLGLGGREEEPPQIPRVMRLNSCFSKEGAEGKTLFQVLEINKCFQKGIRTDETAYSIIPLGVGVGGEKGRRGKIWLN